MKFNIQKYYYKLFDNKKYLKLKEQNLIQETVKIFENRYKSYLFGIENKIKNNKKITFLHSGHLGDLIYALPVIKELAKDHECHFYIQANKIMPVEYYKHPAGYVFIDNRMLDLFLPLMKEQKFIHKVEKYNNQEIDINVKIVQNISIFKNKIRWGTILFGRSIRKITKKDFGYIKSLMER